MSARRYCGRATITMTYLDASSDYHCVITTPNARQDVYVGHPATLTHAVDSPEAFDETAHAALSFAIEEEVGRISADELQHDGTRWVITRNKYDHQNAGFRR